MTSSYSIHPTPHQTLHSNTFYKTSSNKHKETQNHCCLYRPQRRSREPNRYTMDVEVSNGGPRHEVDDQNAPLLQDGQKVPIRGHRGLAEAVVRSPMQETISQTFKSTAHLAKLLPTGTVMAFQLLSPIFTNQGYCDPMSRTMGAILVALCGLSVFLLSFTDSFADTDGNVCHGFATLNGMWVIDGSTKLPPQLAELYRLRFIDFLHAFMSVLVFAAVALFDPNIVRCFYPNPSMETQELLTALPIGIGVVCSMFFVAFPCS